MLISKHRKLTSIVQFRKLNIMIDETSKSKAYSKLWRSVGIEKGFEREF
jgi:hypothetical protein